MDYKDFINKLSELDRFYQIIVCIEELSELQKELCKGLRNGCFDDKIVANISEEIGDCKICLDTMISIFNIENSVNDSITHKIKRTLDRGII